MCQRVYFLFCAHPRITSFLNGAWRLIPDVDVKQSLSEKISQLSPSLIDFS